MPLGTDAIREITHHLRDLNRRETASMVRTLAERYDVSTDTIYRVSRDARGDRKRRADAGRMRVNCDRETLDIFLALVAGKGIGTPLAKEILEAEGHTLPSVATLDRYRARTRSTKRDLQDDIDPCVRWEAEYPNQIWQIDTSGSRMFFRDDSGRFRYMSPLKHTRNKTPLPDKQRIWFVVVVDDYSRALHAMYVPANDTTAWLLGVEQAAAGKGGEMPLCGLPERIYTDNDSAAKSRRFRRSMGLFDPPVEIQYHLPYHKRAKGKSERVIRTLKERFEARYSAIEVPGVAHLANQSHHRPWEWGSIDEANEHLAAWLLDYNNRVHGTTGERPYERWVRGTEYHPPRVIEDDVLRRHLTIDEHECKVSRDLTVAVNGHRYQLPHAEPWIDLVARRITVWWSPEDADTVYAEHEGETHPVHEVGRPVPAGQYRSIKQPAQLRERLRIATSDDPAITRPDPAEARREAPKYVSMRPIAARVPDALPARDLAKTKTEAARWLCDRGHFRRRSPTPAEHADLREMFAGRTHVDISELQRWAEIRKHTDDSGPASAAGAAG